LKTLVSSFIERAKSLGFVAVGFSRPKRPLFFDQFCSWIKAGKQGDMAWLERQQELRVNPASLLEDCRTVISLAYPYSSESPCTPDGFHVARYVEPRKEDYHSRMKKLARILIEWLMASYPESRARVCVDSVPLLERSFAYASGIGFWGKNNMLIVPGHGSFVFLVEILTTVSLPASAKKPMETQCGSCSLCLDCCPSGALEGPFCLDASKCLSYLTIEHDEPVNRETGKKMSSTFFGCDVCQEVCPFNAKGASRDVCLPSTDQILAMEEKEFEERFKKTAFFRAGLEKLKTNILAVKSSS
jgi:epoxyqueuosine reductase